MRLILNGNPIPKLRPRFSSKGKAYDKQSKEKKIVRCLIMKEIADKGHLKRIQAPIAVGMRFHTPIPNSWHQKRRIEAVGKPDPTRPDIDNYAKFYCDLMNDLVYSDDNLITDLWCEKTYSDKPKVEIFITEIKDGAMIKEHATTVKGEVTMEDLTYMVKKANRLGRSNRKIHHVFMEEDEDGKHIYFECDGMRMNPTKEGCL